VAGATAAAMYIDAKYHIKKDLKVITGLKKVEVLWRQAGCTPKAIPQANAKQFVVKENRQSVYYLFEESSFRRGNEECIWSCGGSYTWNRAYDRVNQYGNWFVSHGVKSGDLVAFYLANSPDFIFAWFGLLSIGAAPAFVNYNLSGNSLLHCLKISEAKLMLVDGEELLRERIENEAETLNRELGLKIIVMNRQTSTEIAATNPERPDDRYRSFVKGDSPFCLIYTR
jgi:acyl-CoA synthetase (AMP-forming)/AMP-acid ligase II